MQLGGALTDRRALSQDVEDRAEPGWLSGNGREVGERQWVGVVQRSSVAGLAGGRGGPGGAAPPSPPELTSQR